MGGGDVHGDGEWGNDNGGGRDNMQHGDSGGGTVLTLSDAGCCDGVRNIVSQADKQTLCNCLKDAANRYNISDQYAQQLPTLCNVNIPYKISRSTHCKSIRLTEFYYENDMASQIHVYAQSFTISTFKHKHKELS
ncbi:hypothetical protein VNO78_15546 [Psophocarpus tetragonolobus]|uniref:Non-specific lipid-transfer protein n=1 Tax=Psophocarpus tetragonolobus TaxID=3891 RepID=A0AAN9SGN9_PSOTE